MTHSTLERMLTMPFLCTLDIATRNLSAGPPRAARPKRARGCGISSFGIWAIAVAILGGALPAHAADVTEVASSFQPNEPFEANLSLSYRRSLMRGAVTREAVGRTSTQTGIDVLKELRYSHVEHVLSPRLEVGIWRDLQFHIEIPITMADDRSYSFAQNGGAPCGDPPTTNCITRQNSTLVRDGFLDGSQMTPDQVAVANSDGPAGGLLLPTRSGVDQIYLGLTWAPITQRRDPTKPTWALGFESRIAVGSPMQYSPTEPTANTSVGRGIHQLHFWSSVSRRFRYLDPWISVFYLLPIAANNSLFKKTSFPLSGQSRSGPQHIAGGEIGVEIIPWERPKQRQKVGIELMTRVTAVFEGRGYSPVWELFANSSRLSGPCDPNPSSVDPLTEPPWSNGSYCQDANQTIPYPGITNIENYLNFAGTLAITGEWTKHVRARLGFSFGHDRSHYITFAPVGEARDRNQLVDPNNALQVNPMYRSLIDTPGNRFRVQEATIFDIVLAVEASF